MPTDIDKVRRDEGVIQPKVLFIFAHQDDEFAVYGYIAREKECGAAVHCVYLTDGGWGKQSVVTRNRESLEVLADLGVERDSVAFLGQRRGISDGSLHHWLDVAWTTLVEETAGATFERIYFPAWEGGHQDHDSAHLIGVRLAVEQGRLSAARQFPLYNGAGLRGPFFRVFSPLHSHGPVESVYLSPGQRLRYTSWLLRYRSQWRSVLGLFIPIALRLIFDGRYVVQAVSTAAIQNRPHQGLLLYERRTDVSYQVFESCARDFIDLIASCASRGRVCNE